MPTVLAGPLHQQNKFAIDWGWQGLVAYGCQSCVVVVHPGKVKEVQTLDGHRHPVNKVRWSRENHPHDSKSHSYQLRLASSDTQGQIIIWDVTTAAQHSSFSDQGKTVEDIHWVPFQDTSKDFLVALHAPYNFVLWNADTGTKVWKKSYTDALCAFSFDPFDSANAAFLTTSGSIMLIDDFSLSRTPPSNGKQHFRMSNLVSAASTAASNSGSQQHLAASPNTEHNPLIPESKRGGGSSLAVKYLRKPLMQVFQSAAGTATAGRLGRIEDSPPPADECIQLTYHPAVKHRLLLVYAKEVLFLNLESLQTVAHVVLERSLSPLVQVVPCSQRDAAYLVQESGSVTLRMQKVKQFSAAMDGLTGDTGKVRDSTDTASPDSAGDVFNPTDVYYEAICNSESLRVTKNYRVFGLAVSPTTQSQATLLMSNGRLMFYDVEPVHKKAQVSSGGYYWLRSLVTMPTAGSFNYKTVGKLKFVLSAIHASLDASPTVAKASPVPLEPSKQIVAVGTADGSLQLVDIVRGEIEKDFSVHSCPITCLEWGSSHLIVTAGHTQTLSTSNVVRNELFVTDIRTGLSKFLRPEADETPIEMIRVSYYACYLAVAFREQPLEIWDLNSLRLLRRMSQACPMIVDMSWSGKHHHAKVVRKSASSFDESGIDVLNSPDANSQTVFRENLVLLDNDNHLYHIVVKGMHVRDGKEVNTQWQTNSLVTSMAWKDDYLAFGDNEGKLQLWNLTGKESRAIASQRGGVKKLLFSRTPQEYTLIALHTDGVSIWDMSQFTSLYQLVAARDLPANVKVIDVDLAGEDNAPILITSDDCLRVYDKSLSQLSGPVGDEILSSVFCPSLLPSSVSWVLRCLLIDPKVQNALCPIEFDLDTALSNAPIPEAERILLRRHVTSLDEPILEAVTDPELSIPERALFVGSIFGDEWETNFWSTALYYLKADPVSHEKAAAMDPSNDILMSGDQFKKYQILKCSMFDVRRSSDEHLAHHIKRLILLNQMDQAVQLLLETDSSNSEFFTNCLRACLIAAVHSSSECQSTVKLVATNMIAAGRLSDGVQLLCLIGKSLDACRYLLSYNEWYEAAWLAKVSLTEAECSDIFKRWSDQLCNPQGSQKSYAILILLMLHRFEKVIEILLSQRQLSTAAILLQALEAQESLKELRKSIPSQLMEAVYAEYARELQHIGLTPAALIYCDLAGERGVSLKKEIEILASETGNIGAGGTPGNDSMKDRSHRVL